MMTINKEKKLCFVFTMTFTEDMSQQNVNCDIMTQNVARECRDCLVKSNKRLNLDIDLITIKRYHHQILFKRLHAESTMFQDKKDKFFNDFNMKFEQIALISISSTLNILRIKFKDTTHSKCANIAKQSQVFLFLTILTFFAQNAYCAVLRNFQFLSS